MKKTAIRILLAAILIIPTIIAIVNFNKVKYAPAGEKDVTRIVVEDVGGNTVTYDRDEMGQRADDVIAFFFRLNSNKKKIDEIPESVRQQKPYLVTFFTRVKNEEYRYYFSMDPGYCYVFGSDGESYQLGPDDAAEFLSSDLSRSYYENSTLPSLMLSGTYKVAPKEASWSYRNFRGEFITSDTSGSVSSAEQNFTDNVIFSLAYEVEPDYFGVKVTDNSGETLFDDQKASLGNLNVDDVKEVNVEVTAKWYEDESRAYAGEASYYFSAQISPAPHFRLSADSVVRGGFLTVTAKNVADPSAVSFSSEPDISIDPEKPLAPTFYADGDRVRAIVPFNAGLAAGEYRLTFSCAGADQTVAVTVGEDKAEEALSAAARTEFENLVAEVTSEPSGEKKFDGSFLSGGEYYPCWVIRGFGSRVLINGGDKYIFVNNGVDVQYGWAADVSAINAGTVVYVGSASFTGKVVVIDHGYGVRSWYWNLGDISVEKGAAVQKGDTIGHAGSSGLTDMVYGGVHIALSSGGYFVDPSATWSSGIAFPEID